MSQPVLSYADPSAEGRRSVAQRLPLIGASMVALSFAVGSFGGFFGNPGFPDDVRLLGALGVLIGGALYIVGRISRDGKQSQSKRVQSVLTALIPLVCIALIVPFRMPSVFVTHPLRVWSLYGAEALARYRMTDESLFGVSATLLSVVTATSIVWRGIAHVLERLEGRAAQSFEK